jgi:hypothetical protein
MIKENLQESTKSVAKNLQICGNFQKRITGKFQQSQFPLVPLALLFLAQKQELKQWHHRGYGTNHFHFWKGQSQSLSIYIV